MGILGPGGCGGGKERVLDFYRCKNTDIIYLFSNRREALGGKFCNITSRYYYASLFATITESATNGPFLPWLIGPGENHTLIWMAKLAHLAI
jgi:hypothetical protein